MQNNSPFRYVIALLKDGSDDKVKEVRELGENEVASFTMWRQGNVSLNLMSEADLWFEDIQEGDRVLLFVLSRFWEHVHGAWTIAGHSPARLVSLLPHKENRPYPYLERTPYPECQIQIHLQGKQVWPVYDEGYRTVDLTGDVS